MLKKFLSKKKKDKLSRKRFTIIIGIIAFIFFVFIFGKSGFITLVRMNSQKATLEKEIKLKDQQIIKLKDEIKALRSDPVQIESQARKTGMLKDSEQIIKFVPKETLNKE
ncbi:septum formation initiator family protein [Candidatus Desantisbacteria bacterium]|nr:septum formation initiator family protein [Candidatus Desantisbacteria bacterium]